MEIDGFAVAQNMPDLAEMWMDRFVAFVWWWATRNAQNQQDIEKLRAAEPWLFSASPAPAQAGATGLPNAGAATDEGAQMRRWRKIAGIDDEEE